MPAARNTLTDRSLGATPLSSTGILSFHRRTCAKLIQVKENWIEHGRFHTDRPNRDREPPTAPLQSYQNVLQATEPLPPGEQRMTPRQKATPIRNHMWTNWTRDGRRRIIPGDPLIASPGSFWTPSIQPTPQYVPPSFMRGVRLPRSVSVYDRMMVPPLHNAHRMLKFSFSACLTVCAAFIGWGDNMQRPFAPPITQLNASYPMVATNGGSFPFFIHMS